MRRLTILAGLVLALLSPVPTHAVGHWVNGGCYPVGYMTDGISYVPWSQPFALSPFESNLDLSFGITGYYSGAVDSGYVNHRWSWVGDVNPPPQRYWSSTLVQTGTCTGTNITVGHMEPDSSVTKTAWPVWDYANQGWQLYFLSNQVGVVAQQSWIGWYGEIHITLTYTSSDPV